MLTKERGAIHHLIIGLLLAAAIALVGGLLPAMQPQAGGREAPRVCLLYTSPSPRD